MKTPMFFTASAKEMTHDENLQDTNEKWPMILSPITGKSPRGVNVISGTSAELYGILPGKSYVIKATELEDGDKSWQEGASDKSGNLIRQFQYENVAEIPIETVIAEAIRPSKAGEKKLSILINKPEQGWLKAQVVAPTPEGSEVEPTEQV
jgi:hypothetical protein